MDLYMGRVRQTWDRAVHDETRGLRILMDALKVISSSSFNQLNLKYGITHLYLIEKDRTVFLRAHQNEKRGDRLDRYTMLAAQQSGRDSWGLDMGPLGTFTLRYVRPGIAEGDDGFIELGMEIASLLQSFVKDDGFELTTLIHKEYTTAEKFLAGHQRFQFSGKWDDFPDFVIANQSLPQLPPEIVDLLKRDHTEFGGDEYFDIRTWVCS